MTEKSPSKPLRTDSGDPLADRRHDYAEFLSGSGDHEAAAELMLGALEHAPGWVLGWFRLGEFQEAAGALDRAAEAWRMALALDPADRAGAALKLELIGAAPASNAPPSAFVEALFDQYAEKFEHSLVDILGYRGPDLLVDALRALGREKFRLALDLGCGTGLMGERLRPMADLLEGYDISAEMLKQALGKGIYDRLVKTDLQALAYAGPGADLMTVADVFIYVGALNRVVASIAGMLAPDGLFAFTVEKHDGPEDFVLRPSRRYAHSQSYVRQVLAESGLQPLSLETKIFREDRREPVEGLIVVAGSLPSPLRGGSIRAADRGGGPDS